MAARYIRYEFIGVNAVCALAATIIVILSYIYGSQAKLGLFFFHFRLSLMMISVFGAIICASLVLNAREHLARLHLVTFHVLMSYVMAVNLLISSMMVLVAFNGDYIFKYFDGEALSSPGTFIGFAAVGNVIAIALLAMAAWMSYILVIAYWRRRNSDRHKQNKMESLRIFGGLSEIIVICLIGLEMVYVNMNTENVSNAPVIYFKTLLVMALCLTATLLVMHCRKQRLPSSYISLHPFLVTSMAWCLFVLLLSATIYLTMIISQEISKGPQKDPVPQVLAQNLSEVIYLAYIVLIGYLAVCALSTYTSYLYHLNVKAIRNLSGYADTI